MQFDVYPVDLASWLGILSLIFGPLSLLAMTPFAIWTLIRNHRKGRSV